MVRASRSGRRGPAAAGGRRGRGGTPGAHGGHRTIRDDIVGAGRSLGLRRPVERSTRHTDFEGARQIDRGALRAAAAAMQWADTDIVEQAGEGGVEVRSCCELLTVLAFHHHGLVSQAAAA
eukprot:3486478-Pleurochrysis_carterae.AAC.1